MRQVILVNGPPAAGKSTVVRQLLSPLPEANVFEMDSVKEPFFDALGALDTETSLRLSRASLAAIWRMIEMSSASSVSILDSWVQNAERKGALDALRRIGAERVIEIWCDAPAQTILARYEQRIPLRHPGHPGLEFIPELRRLVAESSPLAIGTLLRVDTERDDLPALARQVADIVHQEP